MTTFRLPRSRSTDYAQWAALYEDAAKRSGAPIETLHQEHHYSKATIRDAVYKARDRGLLTIVGRGRAGGELTEKGRALLADTEETDR